MNRHIRRDLHTPINVLEGHPNAEKALKGIALFGGVMVLIGAVFSPERMWPNYLVSVYYLLTLGIGGLFFVALNYVARAHWAVALRRVPEATTRCMIWASFLWVGVIVGAHTLYEWSHAEVVANDALLQGKSVWLNVPFFGLRSFIYFAIWIGFAAVIIRRSRKQDEDGDPEHTFANFRTSAAFIAVYAITFSLASFDWIMSLEPHWYSTIFGVYNFSGMFVSSIAAISISTIILRRMGYFEGIINESHLHELGKLLFAFSCWWFYIWFCQYMLIWYTNIPEEAAYFVERFDGAWKPFSFLNLVLNWGIPFVFLLPASQKKNETTLFRISVIVLIGHWFDIYLMVMPVFATEPCVGIWEVVLMFAGFAVFLLATFKALGKANVVPLKDPLIEESLHFH